MSGYVQSHPGCTAQDIATALKRPVKSIHGKLNTLEDNNRVRHFTGMSSTSGRKVRRYEHIK